MVVQRVMESRKIQLFCGQSKLFHFDKSQNLFDFHILPQKCLFSMIWEKCFKVWRLKISSIIKKCPKQIFSNHFCQNQMTVGNFWTPRLFCEISTLLLSYVVPVKSRWRFRKILWLSQNIWTLTFDNPWQLWKDYSETELVGAWCTIGIHTSLS